MLALKQRTGPDGRYSARFVSAASYNRSLVLLPASRLILPAENVHPDWRMLMQTELDTGTIMRPGKVAAFCGFKNFTDGIANVALTPGYVSPG